MGEQASGFGDGERDHAGVGGGWSGYAGAGGWVSVWRRSRAAVTAQMARAAMTSTVCRAVAAYSRDLRLAGPEAVLAEPGIFFGWPAQPCGADRPGRGCRLAFGQVTVAEGEIAGGQVAADQQVVPRGGGGQLRPGVPAVSF
jgi:hypothetical protein